MASRAQEAIAAAKQARVWVFGECEFDELSFELRVRGGRVELEAKPLEVLRQLLLRSGEVVSKEELLQAVWPGVLVVDASLANAVSKLRRALGEEEGAIKTVPRVGYRLAVPVSVASRPAEGLLELQPVAVREFSGARPRSHKPVWIGAMVVVLSMAVGGWMAWRKFGHTTAAQQRAIAILPFQNASGNPELDYLRVALPDQISTTLSVARSLAIRPTGSTIRYPDSAEDFKRLGKELGAERILLGHYLLVGDQLQITMEAVDVASDRIVWRDTVNVPKDNLLALQAQIAATVRGQLAPLLGVSAFVRDVTPAPENAEAYQLYLRSLALGADPEPNQQAVAMLRRSLELDPKYARGWATLALRYYDLARFGGGGAAALELSDAAAEKALQLNPDDPGPAGELILHRAERGQLTTAIRQARTLLNRRPDDAESHHTLSYVLRYAGGLDEAGHECDTANMLNPNVGGSCSTTFMQLANYKRALDFVRKDLSSEYSKAHAIEILLRQGKVEQALKIPAPKMTNWESYKMLLACAAKQPQDVIARLASSVAADDDPEMNYFYAGHLAYCGRVDDANRMLQTAVDGHYCSYPAIDNDPFFDKVRSSPGFLKVREAAKSCRDTFVK